jgi:hypothetical protein
MQIMFSVGFALPFNGTDEFSGGFPQVDLALSFSMQDVLTGTVVVVGE